MLIDTGDNSAVLNIFAEISRILHNGKIGMEDESEQLEEEFACNIYWIGKSLPDAAYSLQVAMCKYLWDNGFLSGASEMGSRLFGLEYEEDDLYKGILSAYGVKESSVTLEAPFYGSEESFITETEFEEWASGYDYDVALGINDCQRNLIAALLEEYVVDNYTAGTYKKEIMLQCSLIDCFDIFILDIPFCGKEETLFSAEEVPVYPGRITFHSVYKIADGHIYMAAICDADMTNEDGTFISPKDNFYTDLIQAICFFEKVRRAEKAVKRFPNGTAGMN